MQNNSEKPKKKLSTHVTTNLKEEQEMLPVHSTSKSNQSATESLLARVSNMRPVSLASQC